MLFNSFEFAAFALVVYAAYVALQHRWQNRLLLLASYVFYGSWDWRFLGLILLSTVVDYLCGIGIHEARSPRRRRRIVTLSVVTNLGVLGCFKYLGFFAESLAALAGTFGIELDRPTLAIVLPVGISFYTFQTMSYTLDIYRGQLAPTRSFGDFALFVAFFPQLVAGPIERAVRLLPQIEGERHISRHDIRYGSWLILRGYFKKVVIADNLAPITQSVFANPESAHGTYVLIGIYAFAFQIYGDFSGYSDIARGVSRWLGIDLMVNFRMPYFSTSPQEFWRRWHISLSTWLRDYLYIPLGGNRGGTARTYRNLVLTMLLGGLWHGAAWHFVAWGGFHGAALAIHRALTPWLERIWPNGAHARRLAHLAAVFAFFQLTCFGWLLFAVQDLADVPRLLAGVVSPFEWNGQRALLTLVAFAGPLLALEFFEERRDTDAIVLSWPAPARLVCYAVVVIGVVFAGSMDKHEFIYFQF